MPANAASNLLLDSLTPDLRALLDARLHPVALPLGTPISGPGETPQYAHFVTSGIVSIVTLMANSAGAEVGLIGREGLVEAPQLLGPAPSPTSAFVQVEATALRMRFSDLHELTYKHPGILLCLLEYIQGQTFILSQLAACNGLHEIEERLARWLLMVQDRVQSPSFYLTQEFLAEMLGARRTSVTVAAGSLQRAGLIEYRRGHITILDRDRLQTAACECYPIVRDLAPGLLK